AEPHPVVLSDIFHGFDGCVVTNQAVSEGLRRPYRELRVDFGHRELSGRGIFWHLLIWRRAGACRRYGHRWAASKHWREHPVRAELHQDEGRAYPEVWNAVW